MKMTEMSFRLAIEEKKLLDEIAIKEGKSRSSILRDAIRDLPYRNHTTNKLIENIYTKINTLNTESDLLLKMLKYQVQIDSTLKKELIERAKKDNDYRLVDLILD